MILKKSSIAVLLLLAVMMAATVAADDDIGTTKGARAGERIDWQVVAAGGVKGISTGYTLSGTVGQVVAEPGTSASYTVFHGFWQDFGSSSCCDLAGDANNDGDVTVGDAVRIIAYIFRGDPAPPCLLEGDANGNAKISVGDAVHIISYLFRDGPPPICL